MTFWQGLAISIIVHLDGHIDDDSAAKSRDQAAAIQNLLICVEMLFFSLAHWCVFPVEEWEPNYRPTQMARPGLGLRDFAKDVRVIMRRGQQGAVPLPQEPNESNMDIAIPSPESEDNTGGSRVTERSRIVSAPNVVPEIL